MVRKNVVKTKFMSIFHIKKIIQSEAGLKGLTLECLVVTENSKKDIKKGFLQIRSKCTGGFSWCSNVISIKLPCNFIEITLLRECFPENVLHIRRTLFIKTLVGDCFCEFNLRICIFFHFSFITWWKTKTLTIHFLPNTVNFGKL